MKRSLALLALAALLPLVILRGIVETTSAAGWRADMERHAADHAQAVAALVGQELKADLRSAEMIAQSTAFDGPLDEGRLGIVATRMLQREPMWRAFSISDPAGIRLFDAPGPIGGIAHGPVVDLPSQQAAVRSGKPVVGNIVTGPHGHAAIAVRAPVARDGKILYVVSIIVDPAGLQRLLLAKGLPEGWHVRLFDDAGMLAAASDTSPAKAATPTQAAGARALKPDMHREQNAAGKTERAIWRPVPGTDWRVEVTIPSAHYQAPTLRVLARVTATIAVFVLLFGLFLYLLRRNAREESKRTTTALEAQRLEMLGRMTSSVAHDFNNLLTPILGGFELLSRRIGDSDQRAQDLIAAGLQSADRAKGLVGHLLAYSRRQTLQPRTVDIRRSMEGLRDLLVRTVGNKITLKLKLSDHPGHVDRGPWADVDPVQLELAILNLAINARDAMPDGGELTISVSERTSAFAQVLDPGRYVRIKVTDTGIGMDEATLKAAIEPFFTTKPAGAGTGLGLSMVHGLAAQSGGEFELVSLVGRGTTATLWLPAADEPIEVAAEQATPLPRGSGRLLLVDDEDGVRLAQAEMLRDVGYDVIAVATPAQALGLLRMGAPIDALITDFTMPLMTGAELAWDVSNLRPGLPILILTGYAGAIGDLPEGTGILMKPVRQAELMERVGVLIAPRADEGAAEKPPPTDHPPD